MPSSFDQLLALLDKIDDPRRAEGKRYGLPHILLFSILAVVTGADSYRGICSFIGIHRPRLNEAFGLNWKRAPAHTAIRYILQGLDPQSVEAAFRKHAAGLDAHGSGTERRRLALDGKVLKHSFDSFNDRKAGQVLSAFAADSNLVLAHIEIDEKSNEIPAVQMLLAELAVDRHVITVDAMHCQKNFRGRRGSEGATDRSAQGQPANPGRHDQGALRQSRTRRYRRDPRQGPES